MTTTSERLNAAWETGDRLALHHEAELLAAEGVPESDLYDALERLLLELRAGGADDETEERVMGVMDRVTGWCHESSHIKTRPPATPAAVAPEVTPLTMRSCPPTP